MRSGYDRKRRKARWLPIVLIVLGVLAARLPIVLIVLGVLAALVLLAVGMFYHYYGLSNYEDKAAQTQLLWISRMSTICCWSGSTGGMTAGTATRIR